MSVSRMKNLIILVLSICAACLLAVAILVRHAMNGGVLDASEPTLGEQSIYTLLVIGHEPVMSSLALSLASLDASDPDVAGQIAMKYPTSAIAVLHTDRHWSQVELRSATLDQFHIPR